jgi:hypothetical protein
LKNLIKKIISDQTEAGRAATDFALEMGIPSNSSYDCRMGQDIVGTLIISHGNHSGAAPRTNIPPDQDDRPPLEIDLGGTNRVAAAGRIVHWIVHSGIEVLNVAGREAGIDPRIYQETLKLLRGSYYMASLSEEMLKQRNVFPLLPATIEEALERLTAGMSLKEKTRIARMKEGELKFFSPALAAYVNEKFGLSAGNGHLISACRLASGSEEMDEDGASFLIVRRLCENLKSTHSLRVVARGKGCAAF